MRADFVQGESPLAMAIERAPSDAPVLEAFASIQGEGFFVGMPQVFLRLAGCPLRCRWCDTPGSWAHPDEPQTRVDVRPDLDAVIEQSAQGLRSTPRIEHGPATPLRAAAWIAELDPSGRRAVSVTGGEPLLHPRFLRGLRPLVGERAIHLETAGGHPRTLAAVLDVVDHVSLDLKLPGDLDPPEDAPDALEPSPRDDRDWESARSACLRQLRDVHACGKIVVSQGSPAAYISLLDDVTDLAPELPVVLQPVTPIGGHERPERALLEALVDAALERELDVRVVPQTHRFLRLP